MKKSLEELAKIHKERIKELDSSYEFIRLYRINKRIVVDLKHERCGYLWEHVGVSNFENSGHRCPVCYGRHMPDKKLAYIKFKNRMLTLPNSEEYELVSTDYNGCHNKLNFRHKTCGHIFPMTPQHFIDGERCPHCANKDHDTEWFKDKLKNNPLNDGNEYEVIGEYTKSDKPIEIKHITCGKIFKSTPDNILHKTNPTRCPYCAQSKGEKAIRNFLENHNLRYIPQYRFNDCKDKYTLPFDFYLVDLNILIEYDGELHYKYFSNKKTKKSIKKLKSVKKHDKE